MQLESLKVINWKSFGEYSLEFINGINIIHGPNEAGKSSLQEAIRAVFQTPVAPRGTTLVSAARPWGKKSNPEIEIPVYSTVTLLARFLGISTSFPSRTEISSASSCVTTIISKDSIIGWVQYCV